MDGQRVHLNHLGRIIDHRSAAISYHTSNLILHRQKQTFDLAIATNLGESRVIAKSTMSNHCDIPADKSGVIFTRKEGTQHLNSLRQEDLDILFPGLIDAVLRSANSDRSNNILLI